MKKYDLIAVLVFLGGPAGCILLSKAERKARFVKSNMHLVHTGMTTAEVSKILTEADTVYLFKHKEMYGDNVVVHQYNLGFAAPDVLRVFTRDDKVIDVVSFN